MYPSDNQKPLTALVLLTALATPISLNAKDFGSATLGNTVGALDYYKVTCSGGTDHFQLSVVDLTPVAPTAPQLLNVHMIKGTLNADALAIQPGSEPQTLAVMGSSGKYQVVIDTNGTNVALTKAQTYKYTYQCLYVDGSSGKLTKSGIASLKNTKTAKRTLTINCPIKKKTRTKDAIDVDRLTFTLTDLTKTAAAAVSPIVVNAQVTKDRSYATNTSDVSNSSGDMNYSSPVNLRPSVIGDGDGDYFISVDDTATQTNQDNAKQYAFKYSCLNQENQETTTADAIVIQDQ